MKKRILATLLCLFLFCALLPAAALAGDEYAAYIGSTGYETLQKALDAAEEGDTIIVMPGNHPKLELKHRVRDVYDSTGEPDYLRTVKDVTIEGQGEGVYIAGFEVNNCNYTGVNRIPRPNGDEGNWQSYFAIDGLTFKNITFTDSVTFNYWYNGDADYTGPGALSNITITDCVFDMTETGAYGLKFALGTNAAEEIDKIELNNLTLTNNKFTGVTSGTNSAVLAACLTGDVVITGNEIDENTAWNAIQIQHSVIDTLTIKDNKLGSQAGEGVLNLNNTTAANIAVSDNEITLNEGQPFFCYVEGTVQEALPEYDWTDNNTGVPKPAPEYTAPTANELTYNGGEQELITAGTTTEGTMLYAMAKDGVYSTAIPKATDAGNYTVWYKVEGDDKHFDVSAKSVAVTIARAKLTITAENKFMYVGGRVPGFTFTVSGLIAPDTLSTQPRFSCAADGSRAGRFDIVPGGASAGGNYEITYVNGTLTVYGLPIDIEVSHAVNISASEHGRVSADPVSAAEGDTVRLTAVADSGYELGSLTVTGLNGAEIQLKALGGGQFSFTMPDSAVSVRAASLPFTDVAAGAWYYDAVRYAYTNGLMNGTGAYTFSPNATLNRAMVWTVLARLDGVNTDGGATWYEKAQAWAVAEGVSDGTDPMGAVTREQLVTMLWRFKGEPKAGFQLTSPDADKVSDWACEAMRWAVSEGIIEGDENGMTDPTGTAARAQAAAIFMRFIET